MGTDLAGAAPVHRWWGDAAAVREYWDVELADQGIYCLFCDPETEVWYADGIYD